jgi:hypothetical protein
MYEKVLTTVELLDRAVTRNASLVQVLRVLTMRYHYTHAHRIHEPTLTCSDAGCKMAWAIINGAPNAMDAYRAARQDD